MKERPCASLAVITRRMGGRLESVMDEEMAERRSLRMAFGRCALFAEFVVDAPDPLAAVLVEDHLVAALGHLPDGIGPSCGGAGDRKSTRLNSSHLVISYAVFCLKKK